MEEKNVQSQPKELSTVKAVILLVISILGIVIGKVVLNGDISVVLIVDAAIVASLCMIWGIKWADIEEQMKENFKSMTVPIVILMCVGMLVGIWITSGTIPTMIYYGMKFLNPQIFLVMACLIASLMSVMTGTSWGTVATVGVALMGVSAGLQIPLAYTAGAITVGAIFGDKLSPLSDTTVLSAAVADVDVVDHIKYELFTTVPCLVISLVLYVFLGLQHGDAAIGGAEYTEMMDTLSSTFNINPILLLPPIVVVALIVLKKPTVPTFFAGIVVAFFLALIFQGADVGTALNNMASGYKEATGVAVVDSMVLRGGLSSMFSTIILVLAAGIFGAPLKASGTVQIIVAKLEKMAKNEKQMMIMVGLLHMILFIIVVSYYVSFIIIGNMTKDLYDKFGVSRKNLSRTLEDTGTALAPVIPWGLSGAYYASTLGFASTWDFILYAPITYLSCIVGAFYVITGLTIARADKKENKEAAVK